MDILYGRIKKALSVLEDAFVIKKEPIPYFDYRECGYEKLGDLPLPTDGFRKFEAGEMWGGKKDLHAWFHQKIKVGSLGAGEVAELKIDTDITGWYPINPQFIVYVNGKVLQGLDINHTEIPLQQNTESEVWLYAYTALVEKKICFSATLQTIRESVRRFYYRLLVPFQILKYTQEDSSEYIRIRKVLNETIDHLDFRVKNSREFFQSVADANAYLEEHLYLPQSKNPSQTAVVGIGHTHIDVAWLWTLAQTREKVVRSFSTAVQLLKRYPNYIFMSSQPQLYEFVKEDAPKLYEEIREMVRAGRWEAEGGMWLEADCNLSSGESLIRQILFGKRFFREEFGVDSKILWLPDVFGYSASLPQILKKSGIDTFITSKISWNDTNRMPNDIFDWYGIDGTKIFSYFLTPQVKEKGKKAETLTTYGGTTDASVVAGTYDRISPKELTDEALLTYGWSDGGGGPTAQMLEMAQCLKNGLPGCPALKLETVGAFVNRLKEQCRQSKYPMPQWHGELYLEYHRGTYTSIAKTKRNNRKSEILLNRLEFLYSLLSVEKHQNYPKAKLNKLWKTVLLNQFHDILPGSSVKEVYDVSDKQYDALFSTGEKLEAAALAQLSQKAEQQITVFNPLSFSNTELVTVNGVRYLAKDIPAHGAASFRAVPYRSHTEYRDGILENCFFRIVFDSHFEISSLFDKQNGREILAPNTVGNALVCYEDLPFDYDGWNLESYYKRKKWNLEDVESVVPIEDGIRITRRFLSSRVVQEIRLYDFTPRVDFQTEVEWQEEHLLLKAEFPVDVYAERATYDIPFGFVERPTHCNTSWDEAKFEVCAHRYVDLGDFGYGVSLMSDCKYGYDVHDSVMKLSLLRCATDPNPESDKGHHRFTYSLFPHVGDFRSAGTIREAAKLNCPMSAIAGKISKSFSLVSCNQENIVIETVKEAENGKALVLRIWESHRMHTEAELQFAFAVQKMTECNLLEEEETEVGNLLSFQPFEIKTLKVYYGEK